MDINNNKYISLAEIDKGFLDMGKPMEIVYKAKLPMMKAFIASKQIYASSEVGDAYIDRNEFKFFLLYLR